MSKVDGGLSHRASVLVGKTDQQQGRNKRCVKCAMCQVMIKHPNKAQFISVQFSRSVVSDSL